VEKQRAFLQQGISIRKGRRLWKWWWVMSTCYWL